MQTKSIETLINEKFQQICNEFKYESDAALAIYEWAGYLSALADTKQINTSHLTQQLRRLELFINKNNPTPPKNSAQNYAPTSATSHVG